MNDAAVRVTAAALPRSSSHHVHIALETVKVIGLIVLAVAALSA